MTGSGSTIRRIFLRKTTEPETSDIIAFDCCAVDLL